MIPDDGNKEIDNDYRYNQRYQDRNIKDLVFHESCWLTAQTSYFNVNVEGAGIFTIAMAKIIFVRALI
jgi:hypothetical protein